MQNNIIPTVAVVKTTKTVLCVEFNLPGEQGDYKLYCDSGTLNLLQIEFWREWYGEYQIVNRNHQALRLFCADIDDAIEAKREIPQKVWHVIKANEFRSLWFIDGLNIKGEQ